MTHVHHDGEGAEHYLRIATLNVRALSGRASVVLDLACACHLDILASFRGTATELLCGWLANRGGAFTSTTR